MKICYISDTYPPVIGGIETFVSDLVKSVSKLEKAEKIDVLAFCNEGKRIEKVSEKITVYRFKKYKEKNWITGVILFKELLKRLNFDVYHCFTMLPSGFFTTLFLYPFKKRLFTTIHGYGALSAVNRKRSKFFANIVLRNTKIIFNSRSTMHLVKNNYFVPNCKVIYPGVNVPSYNIENVINLRKKYNIKNSDFVILFVGRLVKRKGCDDLIKTMNMLDDVYKLIIVGNGPQESQLVKLVNDYGLSKRIFFAGRVDFVGDYYKLADVFSMPSKFLKSEGNIEGLGIVFLEAQSLGIPCIGTFSGGIPEAINDGYSGFLVDESSPEQIKEKLIILRNNKDLYHKMSIAAIKFSKKFYWEKSSENHLNFYVE